MAATLERPTKTGNEKVEPFVLKAFLHASPSSKNLSLPCLLPVSWENVTPSLVPVNQNKMKQSDMVVQTYNPSVRR